MRAFFTVSFAALSGALLLTAAAPTKTAPAAVAVVVSPAVIAPAVITPAEPTVYNVDLSHSNILFKCKHLGVSYQYGRFDKFTGSFTLGEDAASSSVSIKVDAESVNSNDPGRDAHLRNADFFNTKQFPEITFESTKVTKGEGDSYSIVGDLTFHGTKKEITMDVEKVGEEETKMGQRAGFEGSFTIDRTDFGVSTYGDLLGSDVKLIFSMEGIR